MSTVFDVLGTRSTTHDDIIDKMIFVHHVQILYEIPLSDKLHAKRYCVLCDLNNNLFIVNTISAETLMENSVVFTRLER